MKCNLKAIAAAMTLAAGTLLGTEAQAAVPTIPGASHSSLVLTAFDNSSTFLLNDGVTIETANRGFVADLGLWGGGAPAFSITDFSSLFNAAFVNVLDGDGDAAPSSLSNIRWNITAGVQGANAAQNQILTTITPGNPPVGAQNQQLQQSVGEMIGYFGDIGGADPTESFTGPNNANPAENWGSNFNGQMGALNNGLGLGDPMELVVLGITTGFFGIQPSDPVQFASIFSSDFTLTDTGLFTNASVVPVPAAVWLMGSALIGLVGVSRRRAVEAAA